MSDSSDRMAHLKQRLLATEIMAQMPDLVNEHAVEFVSSLMKNWYTITNDGEFETTSETPLSTTDLRPMPVDQIGDYLKEKHGYLFRESRPAFESHATTVVPPPNKAQMSLAEKCQFIRVNGEQAFLDLPNSPAEAQPLAERPRSSWSVQEKADFVRRFGSEAYFKIPA